MSKIPSIILFVLILFLISTGQDAADTGKPDEQITHEPVAIPVIQITAKADKAQDDIKKLNQEIEPSKDFAEFISNLPLVLDSLKKLQSNEIFAHLEEQEQRVLNSLHQEWKGYLAKLNEKKNSVLTYSRTTETQLHHLKEMQVVWKLTQEEAQKSKAPRAIKARIVAILKEISETDKTVQNQLNNLLILQNTISTNENQINNLLEKISIAEANLRQHLFVRDSPALWELVQTEKDTLHLSNQFQQVWGELIRSNLSFINLNLDRFYLHIFIFVLLLILMLFINIKNKKISLFDEEDQSLKSSAYFISRPFSAALLIALFLSIWIYPEYPVTVGEFILILLLIPVLRLCTGIVIPEIRKPVYIMAVLYIFDVFQENAVGFIVLQRVILLLVSMAALATLIWILRPGSIIRKLDLSGMLYLLRKIAYLAIFFLFISILANLYGSVTLAKTFTWGVIESSHILLIIYITATVLSGLVTVLIRRRRERAMQFVKTYAYSIERWARYTIGIVGLYIWISATLKVFGFIEPFNALFQELRETAWTIGSVVISIDVIVDFFLIIISTFILSRVIRIFLDMEIFPRLKMPKGLPAAINMMVKYIIVALGIFIALSSVGIDLGKFGILAGALGVGLGFGLQKIVANFISSLILAFGRTIRVGDTVQYEDAFGDVREIGVNASTVKTFDGSDVIIPNADLISNKVTNWTLSDMRRRLMLPVKVAFGNNPHDVLKLLEEVVQAREEVLKFPEPFAVFNGFGDNFLDFSLYYWIPNNLFFKAKTEIALAVYDAITAKGIETPRPQRDVRISAAEKKNLLHPAVKPKSRATARSKRQSPGKKS